MKCLMLLVSLLVLLNDGLAAPIPKYAKKNPTDFYPLKNGNVWKYAQDTLEVEVKCSDVVDDGKGKWTALLTTTTNLKVAAKETLRIDVEGIWQTSLNDTDCDPPLQKFRLDTKDGEAWTHTAKFNRVVYECNITRKDDVEVKVKAGTYLTVMITTVATIGKSEVIIVQWFADGVGIVKTETKIQNFPASTMELKAFEAGK